MTASRLRTLVIVLALALLAVAPAQGATGCDATGDARGADDCVQHEHIGASLDGRVLRGDVIALRQQVDPSLRGTTIVSRVQARRAPTHGRKGPWLEIRRVRWTPGERGVLDIAACRAKLAGRYEFRTVVTPTAAPRVGLLERVAAPLGTSAPTAVTLPSGGTRCVASPDDEANIEYFNLVNFDDGYVISVTQTGTAFSVSLQCPEPESTTIPRSSYRIALSLAGQPTGVGCPGGIYDPADYIVLANDDLARNAYPDCRTLGTRVFCSFAVVAWNLETGTVYSVTDVQILMESTFLIPELRPATMPACPSTLSPCIGDDTCSFTPSQPLELCSSPTSCTNPPSTTSTSSPSIYFGGLQTPIPS